jgi:hypothetical protein
MADPQVLNTLRRKQAEIEGAIAAYERKAEEARKDLAAINAAIRLFSVETEAGHVTGYMDIYRLFKRGEQIAICKAALASEGPLSTPELAVRVMRAKGMDEADKVLRKAVTLRLVHALTKQCQRGQVGDGGRRKGGVRVWRSIE